jgi:hypothetical protein
MQIAALPFVSLAQPSVRIAADTITAGQSNRSKTGGQSTELGKRCANSAAPVEKGESRLRSLESWAVDIRDRWARGPSYTFALARLVCQAKRTLVYGEWERLWKREDLFSKRKANMLVTIDTVLGNADGQTSAHLPCGWTTLYVLARMGSRVIERFIEEGRVHPKLTLKEAEALYFDGTGGLCIAQKQSEVERRINRFAAFMRANWLQWRDEERRLVRATLTNLLQEL